VLPDDAVHGVDCGVENFGGVDYVSGYLVEVGIVRLAIVGAVLST
jgi:hypothetical protein